MTLERIPLSPPEIKPVLINGARPLWSVMIPIYNSIQYLQEAIESVLVQALPKEQMQIEVVDDASTDGNVEELVRNVGKGRISYYRQPVNVGSLRNFETAINRSYGQLIHILHADDKVGKGFYEILGTLLEKYPDAGAAFCRFAHIDENGKKIYQQAAEMQEYGRLPEWLFRIAKYNRIQVVSIVVRREVYEKLGGFYALTYGEDWEMWVRIARHYSIAYTPEILAAYRKHSHSITGDKILTGEYVTDLVKAMNLIQVHLPSSERKSILKDSKRYYAHYALRMANNLWLHFQDRSYVTASIKKALMLHHSLKIYLEIAKLYARMLLNKV